jgi:hypothetical protein
MKKLIAYLSVIGLALLFWICLVSPAMALNGASVSGKIFYDNGNVPNGTIVSLVNGSNVSQYITGFNMTPDKDGFFQFLNVTPGFYKVYAWCPNYFDGYSAGINITSNDTYTASVVLRAKPYFADMVANPMYVTYGGSSDITATIYDYLGKPIGAGWQILFNSTVGTMDPNSTITDQNGKVYSRIGYVENASFSEITVYAINENGSSYYLNSTIKAANVTAIPSAVASATATPSASPTVVPNATVTATATALPSTTATATAIPTPGFELLAALTAIGMALAIRRYK